jgi:hypothetical protein
MASSAQIQANRLNAQKSTGPRTPEGKRASSQNALKSGLDAESQFVPGESPQEFAALQAEYFERFAPTSPEQRFQVDNLIRNEWLLRRYHRVEAQVWQYQSTLCDQSSGVQLGEAFSKAATIFQRLARRIAAVEKSYKEAMAELTRLQAVPAEPPADSQIAQMASFLNTGSDALDDFVFSQMEKSLARNLHPEPFAGQPGPRP